MLLAARAGDLNKVRRVLPRNKMLCLLDQRYLNIMHSLGRGYSTMVATGQEIVREKKNSSRSGKSPGISL